MQRIVTRECILHKEEAGIRQFLSVELYGARASSGPQPPCCFLTD